MKRKAARALIAPIEIAGFYTNLARELRGLGIYVDLAFYYENTFDYREKGDSFALVRIIRKLKKKSSESNLTITKLAYAGLAEIFSLVFTLLSLRRYDNYIFGFGASLLTVTHLDLIILKLFRKKVISVVAHGSECRPPFMNGRFSNQKPEILAREAFRLIWNLRWMENFASEIIGSPYSTSIYANRPFLNFFDFGLPSPSVETGVRVQAECGKAGLKVLHAPSSRATKGTSDIIKIVDRVRNEGHPINLTILEGYSNAALLERIPQFDLVIDQLYCDTPMPGLALECVHLGVPVLVAGYQLRELESFMPNKRLPPTIICHPDELKNQLIRLTKSQSQLVTYKEESSRYVLNLDNRPSVGKAFLEVMEGNHQLSKINPREIRYFEGIGQPQITTARQILSVYDYGGVRAMGLKAKPELANEILDWARKVFEDAEATS